MDKQNENNEYLNNTNDCTQNSLDKNQNLQMADGQAEGQNLSELDCQDKSQSCEQQNIDFVTENLANTEQTAFTQNKNVAKKNKSITKRILNISFWVVCALLVVFIVFINTFQLCLVMGSSMNDTLHDADYLLMQKAGYDIDRGDIITIFVDKDDKHPIIKRVIAIKGDKIVFMQGTNGNVDLYLDKGNGFKKLNEKYINDGKMSQSEFSALNMFKDGTYKISPSVDVNSISEEYIINVDSGLFVLGDNRDNSYDSRHYGILSYKNVQGKMISKLKKDSFIEKFLKFLFNA